MRPLGLLWQAMVPSGLVGDGLQLVGPEVLDLAGVLDLGGGRAVALRLERKLHRLLYLNLESWCVVSSRPGQQGGGGYARLGGGGGGHGDRVACQGHCLAAWKCYWVLLRGKNLGHRFRFY